MPFIWGSGSAWKILIRSQNTTVKKAILFAQKTRCRQLMWFARGHQRALVLKGTRQTPAELFPPTPSPRVTSQNHHITYSCPPHKGFSVTDWSAGHRGWRVFPMEGAFPAWGSCVNSSPLNPTGLPRHSCSLKPKQTLAGIIKRCAWKAKISYSIKGLKSHFQPCLIT